MEGHIECNFMFYVYDWMFTTGMPLISYMCPMKADLGVKKHKRHNPCTSKNIRIFSEEH